MTYDVDRQPAAWVSAEAGRRFRLTLFLIASLMLLAATFTVLAIGHVITGALSLVVSFIVIASFRKMEAFVDLQLRWQRGADAERAVGNTLNTLRPEWTVMHDIRRTRAANIDHIASGPTGVFVIETKDRGYLNQHLRRVMKQALEVHAELDCFVTPVIALNERDGRPFKSKGVWVVPRQHLTEWLRAQHNRPVPFERLARFADSL